LDIFSVWQQSLLSAWGDLVTRVILFLPSFFGAIIVFVIGILVANWLSKLTGHVLRLVKFSALTQTAGLDKFLKKADINYDTSGLISLFVKWFVILVFFMATTNILGLTAVASVINNLISYIPNVITAALIIAGGMFVANISEGLVRGALTSIDHSQAKSLSRFARWAILVVAILAGINELKIAQSLVTTFFQGLTWTLTLSVGLAIGLGTKDLIAQILKDWYERLKK
jgi:hypothetical protein